MLLDTSAIVEILTRERGSRVVKEISEAVSGEELYASAYKPPILQIGCLRNDRPMADRVSTVKELIVLVPLDEQIMIEASENKEYEKERQDSPILG